MRSWIKKLLTLTLAILLVFSCIGCNKNNTGNEELNQWDYFEEWGWYSLYTLDEKHKDYEKWQGWGVITDTVYTDYLLRSRVPFEKEDLTPTIVRNFYELVIRPTTRVSEIILNKFSIDVGSLTNQNIRFSVYIGSTYIKDVEIDAVAGELTTMEVVFSPKTWETGSKLAIFLRLKYPSLVEPYTLKNLTMDIEKK